MAIDFYKISDRKHQEILFNIDDGLYSLLEPVLDAFTALTGIYLDPFADTRLTEANVKLIAGLLDKFLQSGPVSLSLDDRNKVSGTIVEALRAAAEDLLAVGD